MTNIFDSLKITNTNNATTDISLIDPSNNTTVPIKMSYFNMVKSLIETRNLTAFEAIEEMSLMFNLTEKEKLTLSLFDYD